MAANSASISNPSIEVMHKICCQTTRKRSQYCFEWTIREFSSYRFRGNRKLESTIFSTGANFEWRMELSRATEDYLSASLQLVSGIIDESNEYKISFLNAKRKKFQLQSWVRSANKFTCERFHICERFVYIETLHDKTKELLPDDCLTLCCEVSGPGHSLDVR